MKDYSFNKKKSELEHTKTDWYNNQIKDKEVIDKTKTHNILLSSDKKDYEKFTRKRDIPTMDILLSMLCSSTLATGFSNFMTTGSWILGTFLGINIVGSIVYPAKCISQLKYKSKASKNTFSINLVLSMLCSFVLPMAIANVIVTSSLIHMAVLGIVATGIVVCPAKLIHQLHQDDDTEQLNSNGTSRNNDKKDLNKTPKAKEQTKKRFDCDYMNSYSLNDLRKMKERLEEMSSGGFKEETTSFDPPQEQGPILKKKK